MIPFSVTEVMYRSQAVTAFPSPLHQVTFKPGQKLYLVNRLYPYTLQFREESPPPASAPEKRSRAVKRPHQRDPCPERDTGHERHTGHERDPRHERDPGQERDQAEEKIGRVSAPSHSTGTAWAQNTHTPVQTRVSFNPILYSKGLFRYRSRMLYKMVPCD